MNRRGYGQSQMAIRQALADNPDGLTFLEISELVGLSHQAVCNSALMMQDLCVDRWKPNPAGNQWVKVMCLKPEDAPKPEMAVSVYLRKAKALEKTT